MPETPLFPTLSLWLVLPALIAAVPVQACSVCGCGDPQAAAGDARPVAGQVSLQLDWERLGATAASDDDPAKTEALTQTTWRPVLVVSAANSLNLVLQVPVVDKAWVLTGGDHPDADAHPVGLGDVDLGARFFVATDVDLPARFSATLAVSMGSTLPTGDDTALDSNGDRLDQHAQLGTGAYGPYAGLVAGLGLGDWDFSANAYARTHSVNAFDYAFGNAVTGGLQARYQVLDWLGLSFAAEARYAERDLSQGVAQENTGGTLVDLTPGLSLSPGVGLTLLARAQFPVFIHLYGSQGVDPTVTLSARYSLF